MRQEPGPDLDAVDRWAFAETVEDGPQRRSSLRLGPAIGAAVAAVLVVLGVTIIPQLKNNPMGLPQGQPPAGQVPGGSGQNAGGQTAAAQAPQGGQGQFPGSGQVGSSGSSLTYANHVIVGPGGACCSSSGGTWSAAARGGYPEYGGPARTSADSRAWFEWDLGQPAGGARWDQLKIRVWIPQTQAGAWVRVTVTSTAAGASNVTSFDVAEQEYEGWYELPARFTIGTPDRRTGSAWVRMTYLRAYADTAAGATCADGSCGRMAAAQTEFLWS
jgi:hypothetical protein